MQNINQPFIWGETDLLNSGIFERKKADVAISLLPLLGFADFDVDNHAAGHRTMLERQAKGKGPSRHVAPELKCLTDALIGRSALRVGSASGEE